MVNLKQTKTTHWNLNMTLNEMLNETNLLKIEILLKSTHFVFVCELK